LRVMQNSIIKKNINNYFRKFVAIFIKKYLIMIPLFIILFFMIVYPLGTLVLTTFRTDPPRVMDLTIENLTLSNYIRVFSDPGFIDALRNTLLASLAGTTFATIIGSWLAWLVVRTNVPFKKLIEVAAITPLFLSVFIGALAWAMLASPRAGFINVFLREMGMPFTLNIYSMGGIIFVFSIYFSPYVFMFTSSALRRMDPILEEAASISGAGSLMTSLKVTFPLVLPAISSSAILVFVLMCEEFAIPSILGSPANLEFITYRIFKFMSYSPPQLNLAATLGVLLITVIVFLLYIQSRILSKHNYVTISGKGLRPKVVNLGNARILCSLSGFAYIFIAIILPYTALVQTAFRKFVYLPDIKSFFSIETFTLSNFQFVFSYPLVGVAIRNTLFLAILCSMVGALLYFLVSYIINKTNIPGRRIVDYITMMPIAVAGLVIGMAYLWAWITLPIGIYGTIWILALAYISRFAPQGIRSISSSIVQIHPELEEAAKICGSSFVNTMYKIFLPLVKPGVVSAMTLLTLLSVRELSASIFLYNHRTIVLSIAIFDFWETGLWGGVTALALLQTVILILIILAGQKIFKAELLGSDRNS
jgi:iron(III) transport system permease protein